MQLEVVLSIISAISVLTLGLLQWRSTSKVQKAEAIDKIGDAYNDLLDRLKVRIENLENRVVFLEKELKKYKLPYFEI